MKRFLPVVLFVLTVIGLLGTTYLHHIVQKHEAEERLRSQLADVQKQAEAQRSSDNKADESLKTEQFLEAQLQQELAKNNLTAKGSGASREREAARIKQLEKALEEQRNLALQENALEQKQANEATLQSQQLALTSDIEKVEEVDPAKRFEGWMPVIVSGALGLSALWMILSQQFPANSLKWAYSTLGTIVGYWLRH